MLELLPNPVNTGAGQQLIATEHNEDTMLWWDDAVVLYNKHSYKYTLILDLGEDKLQTKIEFEATSNKNAIKVANGIMIRHALSEGYDTNRYHVVGSAAVA